MKRQLKKIVQAVNISNCFNKLTYILLLLLVVVGVFEFLPVIKEAQRYVSIENYEDVKASCQALLSGRPWYGRVNHWFFVWIIFVPTIIFSISPKSPKWLLSFRTIFAVLVCYGLMFLAVINQWDIRNVPFMWNSYPEGSANGFRNECVNIADGFSLIFSIMFGWVPACVYTWICLNIWFNYHKRITKQIVEEYKIDIVTKIFAWGMRVYFVLLGLFVLYVVLAKLNIVNLKWLGFLYYPIARPLLIPFEIFVY